jgi:hypothetical protein
MLLSIKRYTKDYTRTDQDNTKHSDTITQNYHKTLNFRLIHIN